MCRGEGCLKVKKKGGFVELTGLLGDDVQVKIKNKSVFLLFKKGELKKVLEEV